MRDGGVERVRVVDERFEAHVRDVEAGAPSGAGFGLVGGDQFFDAAPFNVAAYVQRSLRMAT